MEKANIVNGLFLISKIYDVTCQLRFGKKKKKKKKTQYVAHE